MTRAARLVVSLASAFLVLACGRTELDLAGVPTTNVTTGAAGSSEAAGRVGSAGSSGSAGSTSSPGSGGSSGSEGGKILCAADADCPVTAPRCCRLLGLGICTAQGCSASGGRDPSGDHGHGDKGSDDND